MREGMPSAFCSVDERQLESRRVAKKHVWVNVGFVSTTVALASLLATVVSYVVRVA